MLACAREIKSADTEAVVSEFAAILKSYGLTYVYGDRYGAQWVADAFKRHGIDLRKSPHDRSGLYLNLLPMLNSGQARLLDLPRIRSQLLALERRTIRGTGRDVIDHPQAGADDLINSVAGALVIAATVKRWERPAPVSVPSMIGAGSHLIESNTAGLGGDTPASVGFQIDWNAYNEDGSPADPMRRAVLGLGPKRGFGSGSGPSGNSGR
jgi:hypothetical protein